MKERPILMNAVSVRAILDGHKGQTRRVIKPQPPEGHWWAETSTEMALASQYYPGERGHKGCPYGIPGDRLWVREGWRIDGWNFDGDLWVEYRTTRGEVVKVFADAENVELWERLIEQSTEDAIKAGYPSDAEHWDWDHGQGPCRWRPSIFMPRWASRIMLEVVRVRAEQVQDISAKDVEAEGVNVAAKLPLIARPTAEFDALILAIAHREFAKLWDSINAKHGFPWEKNPWVWVVEFKVL